MREPSAQFLTAVACVQTLDAEAKLGQSHRADVKLIQRTAINKRQNFRLRL
jgi:hypothetical protein